MASSHVRTLCVEGNGARGIWSSANWHKAETGIGLSRGLEPDLLRRLQVRYTTHARLFDNAANTAIHAEYLDGDFAPGADYQLCMCCPPGYGYWFYRDFHNWMPSAVRHAVHLAWAKCFLPDVELFMTNAALRRAVVGHVRANVDRVLPHVVIGHSLGSVIAIEALAQARHAPHLLITAGAPLAWPQFIASWSSRAHTWLDGQECQWLNLVDLSDEVTANRIPLRAPYPGATHVVVNNDYFASTALGEDAGINSVHRARHYLRHPAVGTAIKAAMNPALK